MLWLRWSAFMVQEKGGCLFITQLDSCCLLTYKKLLLPLLLPLRKGSTITSEWVYYIYI